MGDYWGAYCTQDTGSSGCVAPYVCYIHASWYNNTNLCTCSYWYGWSGDDCLELSGASYFLISSAGIQASAAFIGLALATVLLARYFYIDGCKFGNIQVITLILLWLALVVLICWRVVTMMIVLTPWDNTLEIKANDEGRVHQLTPVERAMIGLTMCLGTLALLNASLVWVQIARLSRHLTHNMRWGLSAYRRTVYVFEGLLVIGLTILFGLGLTGYVTFFAAPFLLFMIVCFAYGAVSMTSLLSDALTATTRAHQGSMNQHDELEQQQQRHGAKEDTQGATGIYNTLIFRVQRTAFGVVATLALTLMCGIIYTGLTLIPEYGQRSTIDPHRKAHVVVLFNEAIPFFILCAQLTALYYLYFTVLETVRKSWQTSTSISAQGVVQVTDKPLAEDEGWSFGSSVRTYARSSVSVFDAPTPKNLQM